MKTEINSESEDDLRPEYDLSELLKHGIKGKYAMCYKSGTNLVLLDPDVAKAFPSEKAVNDALRLAIQIAKIRTNSLSLVMPTNT